MQVKICGITNLEDALFAAQYGAAALGFIFYPPSPRFVAPQKARDIIAGLPAHLVKVGVFVNEKKDVIDRIFEDCRLDMLQLHGDESPAFCRQFPGRRIIKALELKSDGDPDQAAAFETAAILVDARQAGLYGGTGRTANWELACRMPRPVILSGGLTEDNVLDGLRKVKPVALDINSGVEERPGKKNAAKIARMMQIIQQETAGDASPQIFVRREQQ
ncbi:MAG: phosphoribosylanthranilate isomerase [Deltaproteobacteria bacterium]|jgi:phosphoribosylanthranilate isomerase